MRRAVAALAVTVLSACGSSGPPPALYQGFAPLDGTAMIFPRTDCDIAFLGPTSAVGVAITLTDFADTCGFLTGVALCGSRADSTFIQAIAVDGVVGGTAPAALAPGTFPYLKDPPTGAFKAAVGTAVRTTATCQAQPSTSLDMASGSIVIATITDTRVTGTLNLTFDDGSVYRQPFDVARCAPPAGLCDLLTFGACVPSFPPWTCVGAH